MLIPSSRNPIRLLAMVLTLSLGAGPLPAQLDIEDDIRRDDDARVRMNLLETWSNLFAGQETTLQAAIHTKSSFAGTLSWRLTAGTNTIAENSAPVKARAFAPVTVEIALPIPPLSAGGMAPAELSLSLLEEGFKEPAVIITRKLWVMHPNPFHGRDAWAASLNLALFDPGGNTAARLTDLGIPFTRIEDVDLSATPIEGILIVGEGLALADYTSVFDSLVKLADAGISSICLAPLNGEIGIPGMGEIDLPKPRSIAFKDHTALNTFDPRLDTAWPRDGELVATRLRLSGAKGAIFGHLQELGDGWPWVELAYGEGKGTIYLCGFMITAKWEETPAPRYLLLRMLEHLHRPAAPAPTTSKDR